MSLLVIERDEITNRNLDPLDHRQLSRVTNAHRIGGIWRGEVEPRADFNQLLRGTRDELGRWPKRLNALLWILQNPFQLQFTIGRQLRDLRQLHMNAFLSF